MENVVEILDANPIGNNQSVFSELSGYPEDEGQKRETITSKEKPRPRHEDCVKFESSSFSGHGSDLDRSTKDNNVLCTSVNGELDSGILKSENPILSAYRCFQDSNSSTNVSTFENLCFQPKVKLVHFSLNNCKLKNDFKQAHLGFESEVESISRQMPDISNMLDTRLSSVVSSYANAKNHLENVKESKYTNAPVASTCPEIPFSNISSDSACFECKPKSLNPVVVLERLTVPREDSTNKLNEGYCRRLHDTRYDSLY